MVVVNCGSCGFCATAAAANCWEERRLEGWLCGGE